MFYFTPLDSGGLRGRRPMMTEQERKNVNELRYVLVLIFIGFVVMSIALFRERAKEPQINYIQDPNYVQNIGEAQRRLKEQGLYDGKIDYLWGLATDKAYCDWCGIEAIEGE